MIDVNAERWRKLQDVLDGALELSAEEQTAFVERTCAGDPSLRANVRALLDAIRSAGDFLEEPASELALEAIVSPGLPSGTRIGPFRILQELGRGGMGVVYVAVRDDGHFEQRVALKLVSDSIEPESAARRMREERRILASLNHPEIARLIDGGVTADGHPWFAMELVEGTPIDRYCSNERLTIEKRLELFARVADAVQFAHQNLVVHRDLKPSNILVAKDMSIKLLDFGIAKVLTHDSEAGDETTGGGARWFTPQYASPEQVRGQPVSTASDVYTLGVLLYHCLTGRRPYEFSSLAPAAIATAVCEVEPERPSTAALREPGAREYAEAMRLQPERLARQLRGDLDTIVAKAMHKDAARRYASAGAFADDVRRHLAGHPVLARTDSLAYRASKFVRRHRVGVAASVALLLSLIGGGAGIVWQASIASGQRDNARQQAATAGQVSRLLVDMFRLSESDSAQGATVTAREVLASGARRIERDFAGQPLLRASMLRELGTVYVNLGLHEDAEKLVRQAAQIWRDADRPDELAQALDQIGQINLVRARPDTAEVHLREALYYYQHAHEGPHISTAGALELLADALRAQRKFEPAESLYRAALVMERQLHGAQHPRIATILFDLASSYHERGKFPEAEPLFREALAIYRAVPGTLDVEAAAALINLANVQLFREDYANAEPLMREALTLRQRIYRKDHPALVEGLLGLGTLLHNTSRFREAEPVLERALDMATKIWGAPHPQTQHTKIVLAATYNDQGRYDEAMRLYDAIIDAPRDMSASDEALAIYARHLRGESELARGDVAAAQASFARVTAEGQRVFGKAHPYIALGIYGRVGLPRIADGGRNAGIGHRHNHIGISRRLAAELHAHFLAHFVDLPAADD
jgi:serine/threonine-protein kinase